MSAKKFVDDIKKFMSVNGVDDLTVRLDRRYSIYIDDVSLFNSESEVVNNCVLFSKNERTVMLLDEESINEKHWELKCCKEDEQVWGKQVTLYIDSEVA